MGRVGGSGRSLLITGKKSGSCPVLGALRPMQAFGFHGFPPESSHPTDTKYQGINREIFLCKQRTLYEKEVLGEEPSFSNWICEGNIELVRQLASDIQCEANAQALLFRRGILKTVPTELSKIGSELFTSREEDASIGFATEARFDEFSEARITDRSPLVDTYSCRLPSNVRGGDTIEMGHHLIPRFLGRPPSGSAGIRWMHRISQFFEKWTPLRPDLSNILTVIVVHCSPTNLPDFRTSNTERVQVTYLNWFSRFSSENSTDEIFLLLKRRRSASQTWHWN